MMKTTVYLSLFINLIFSIPTYSQWDELKELNYTRKLNYSEIELSYYAVDREDLNNLSLADKVKMNELMYEREYEETINAAGEHQTLINHISSKNVYKDWMNEPEIVLINKDFTALYSFDGKLKKQIPHSAKYLSILDKKEARLLPKNPFPTQQQLNEFRAHGLRVEHENQRIQVSSDSYQTTFNLKKNTVETVEFDDENQIKSYTYIHYVMLPSRQWVKNQKKQMQMIELDNQIKSKHIRSTLYSNYRYEDKTVTSTGDLEKQKITFSCNGNGSELSLKYSDFTVESNLELVIYSIHGEVQLSKMIENTGNNTLSIQELAPGMYIAQLRSGNIAINGKFVKQ